MSQAVSPPKLGRERTAVTGFPNERAVAPTAFADGRYKSDYVHPNAEGYRKIAERVREFLDRKGAL